MESLLGGLMMEDGGAEVTLLISIGARDFIVSINLSRSLIVTSWVSLMSL